MCRSRYGSKALLLGPTESELRKPELAIEEMTRLEKVKTRQKNKLAARRAAEAKRAEKSVRAAEQAAHEQFEERPEDNPEISEEERRVLESMGWAVKRQ